MKIVIAGGTGFIGRAMVKRYLSSNHEIIIIGRDLRKIQKLFDRKVKPLLWQDLKERSDEIKEADLLINLAGAGIGDKPWTTERKAEILNSRITPTSHLVEICSKWGQDSPPLFNASAVGVFCLEPFSEKGGLPPALDENTPIDFLHAHVEDFLGFVARQWEMTTWPARNAGVRVVNMRFGIVLGKKGGALSKLKIPYLFGLGGKIGSGKQPFCWIALPDLLRAVDFLFERPSINSPVDFVAPECITQAQFANALGKALHRPTFITIPKFVIEWVFGQMGEELLLGGQHVVPTILKEQGFQFEYRDIQSALNAIF